MRVIMLRTQTGSPDGFTINTYHQGVEYDLVPDLALAFIGMGAAAEAAIAAVEAVTGPLPSVPDLPEIPEPKGERRGRRARK